jgi:hypothetical protein
MEVSTNSSGSSSKKVDPVHVCNKFRVSIFFLFVSYRFYLHLHSHFPVRCHVMRVGNYLYMYMCFLAVCVQYIMHAELAANNYLVVVERPPVSLMECLPAILKKKKFGT